MTDGGLHKAQESPPQEETTPRRRLILWQPDHISPFDNWHSMALAAAARQSIWLLATAPAARLGTRLCSHTQLQRAHRLLHTTARTTARRALDPKLVPHGDTAVQVRGAAV